jgi:hypothetical protein
MAQRNWTLEAARALLPEVRERTARAVGEAERLLAKREGVAEESGERKRLDRAVEAVMSRWSREMEAFGLEVKGPWLVDFDSGGGYYCWKWPEERLEWFHGYDDGFAGRVRIH